MQTSCKSGRLKSNVTWGNTKSQNYAQMYDALCRMLQLKSERDPDTKKDKGTGTIAHFNGGGGGVRFIGVLVLTFRCNCGIEFPLKYKWCPLFLYHRSSILLRADCAFVFVFSYHMDCLTPPAEFVPLDEWFCPSCSSYQEPEEQEDDNPRELTRARTTRGRPRGSTARRVSGSDRTGTVDVDF